MGKFENRTASGNLWKRFGAKAVGDLLDLKRGLAAQRWKQALSGKHRKAL
jgi:hypothetical protein